jgi:hypothetical protein
MIVGFAVAGHVERGQEKHREEQSGAQHFIDFPFFAKTVILRKRAGPRTP